MVDVESILYKLDQNEKIIRIVSESIPHLSILGGGGDAIAPSSSTSRRLLSTSNTTSSSPQSPHIISSSSSSTTPLIQSVSNGSNLNQLGTNTNTNTNDSNAAATTVVFDSSITNDVYIFTAIDYHYINGFILICFFIYNRIT